MADTGLRSTEFEPWLRCARCNYDLRGASIGGKCSECGLPVADSRAFAEALLDPGSNRSRSLSRLLMAMAGLFALMGASLNVTINLGPGAINSPGLLGIEYYGGSVLRCILMIALLYCVHRARMMTGGAAVFTPAGSKQVQTLPWIVVGFVIVHLLSVLLDYSSFILNSRFVMRVFGSSWGVVAAMLYVNRVLWPVALGAMIALALGVRGRIGSMRSSNERIGGRSAAWIGIWIPIGLGVCLGLWLFAEACVGRAVGRAVGVFSAGDALSSVPIGFVVLALALGSQRLRVGRADGDALGAGASQIACAQARRVLGALGVLLGSLGLLFCIFAWLMISRAVDWGGDSDAIGFVAALGLAAIGLVALITVMWRMGSGRPIGVSSATHQRDATTFFVLALSGLAIRAILSPWSSYFGVLSFERGVTLGLGWAFAILVVAGARSTLLAYSDEIEDQGEAPPGRGRARVVTMMTALLASFAYVQARGLGFVSAILELFGVRQYWLGPIKATIEVLVFVPALIAVAALLFAAVHVRRRVSESGRSHSSAPASVSLP